MQGAYGKLLPKYRKSKNGEKAIDISAPRRYTIQAVSKRARKNFVIKNRKSIDKGIA